MKPQIEIFMAILRHARRRHRQCGQSILMEGVWRDAIRRRAAGAAEAVKPCAATEANVLPAMR
jgi:hypothetical protein